MFFPEVKSQIGEDICILIKLDNHAHNYICECGDASNLTVKECQNTSAIFLSHTHIDHFVNFDTILRHQVGVKKRIVICGPKHIAIQVQAKLKAYTWNLVEADAIIYEVREIVDEGKIDVFELRPPLWELTKGDSNRKSVVYDNDRFHVTYTILDHKIPTIAYQFSEADSININFSKTHFKGGSWVNDLKKAFLEKDTSKAIKVGEETIKAEKLFHLLKLKKGSTLGVIMDHAFSSENHEKIKTLFKNCDQVFIESFYKKEDIALAKTHFHSYSEASGKLMKACGVKEAIPVHFSRKYSQAEIEDLMNEFTTAFNE